jgi:D-glycero-D-manno-heptose 1,7-bisphosphate phosphatase
MAKNVLDNALAVSYNNDSYDKCVVGLDRDGVINQDIGTYVTNANMFIPIENSLAAVALIRSKGHKIAIITNQGGIEKGIMKESDVDSVHTYMFELLGKAGCPSVDALYYSASSQKNNMYAKPNTGMFKRCEKEHPAIKFSKGIFVGDKLSDLKAAVKMGATPILVRTGYGQVTEKELNKFSYKSIKKKTIVFDNLWDFAQSL